jgi:hypothetical protein
MKTLWLLPVLLAGCAGFKPITRAEWVLAWSDESVQTELLNDTPIEVVKPAPGARQVVISRDRYDSEVAEGRRRKVVAFVGTEPPLFTALMPQLTLTVGDVKEVRIVEQREACEVEVQGSAVAPYLDKVRKNSTFLNGDEQVTREASLFLVADDDGKSQLRVTCEGKPASVLEVVVQPKS